MVNANVIISVSAVLVALLLTIVIVMRVDGDPTDNFSITVRGTYTSEDAKTYDADMYYCVGTDCVFYHYVDSTPVDYVFNVGEEFPGYFALVGFIDEEEGETYVTEHSIGYTFVYKDGALTACYEAQDLDNEHLNTQVEGFAEVFSSEDRSMKDENGNVVYQMNYYELDTDPTDDVPTVNGHGVPTVHECKLLWAAEAKAACDAREAESPTGAICETESVFDPASLSTAEGAPEGDDEKRDASDDPADEDTDLPQPDEGSRRLDTEGRSLAWADGWGSLTAMDAANIAQWVYKNDDSPGLPSGWNEWNTCEKIWRVWFWGEYGRSTARFAYKWPSGGARGHMVLAFAGSNDISDWLYNAKLGSHSVYHQGFHDYVQDVKGCVDRSINKLTSWGIPVNYVVGHSLGGAAASVYIHMKGGLGGAKVVTFGAPKSRRNSRCSNPGHRFFHARDPVPSNFEIKIPVFNVKIAALGAFSHDVSTASKLWNQNTNQCNKWGNVWEWHRSCGWGCWWYLHVHKRCVGYVQTNHLGGAWCGEVSSTTLAIDKHSMNSYKAHAISGITV